MNNKARLKYFPIAFFSVIMGLAGLTIAWKKAEVVFNYHWAVSHLVQPVTVAVFIVLGVFYLTKVVRYPEEVLKELNHPVKLNFFPTVSIGLILLSIVMLENYPSLSRWLWMIGVTIHLGLTLYVMTAWIHHTKFEVTHINPAWFMPVVGNILVPIAGVKLYSPEVSWFFFSTGIVFWLVLFTIVMYRLFFHAPLPERFTPTLFILIAPPAVGFIAYFSLSGTIDAFARVLYYCALLLTLLLASNVLRFLRTRFFLSAWAYSFPLAAITIASLIMTQQLGVQVFAWIATALLAILTLVVVGLSVRTLIAVARGEICIEEG